VDKPDQEYPTIEHFLHGLDQIARERKERCIHCNEEWYSIHYKDGVCHLCQQKGLPGRTKLTRRSPRIILLGIWSTFGTYLVSHAAGFPRWAVISTTTVVGITFLFLFVSALKKRQAERRML